MESRSRTAVVARVVTVLVLTAALAACGPQTGPPSPPSGSVSSDPAPTTVAVAPEELLQQAMRNMLDAPSKRMVGIAAVSISTQEFEVVFVGEDAKGTRTERALGVESVVEFVRAGDSLYIRASEHYWQSYLNLEQLAGVRGEWVRVPADHPEHGSLLVIQEDTGPIEPEGTVTQSGTDAVDGTPAFVLEDSAGNRFFVSADGTPYLLRIEATQDTEFGEATIEMTFSEVGTVTETITAPSGEIIDLR